jgi:hypothetical protein
MPYVEMHGLRVEANDISRNGLVYNNVVDWDAIRNTVHDNEPIPNQVGSFGALRSYVTKSTVSVEGVFVGNTPADVEAAKTKLRAIYNHGEEVRVVYDNGVVASWRNMKAMAVNIPHTPSKATTFSWSIDFFSEDPYRYLVTPSTSFTGPATPGTGVVFNVQPSGVPGASYLWAGTPNLSRSNQWYDGRIARTNYLQRPQLENGNNQGNRVVQASSTLWQTSGGRSVALTPDGSGATDSFLTLSYEGLTVGQDYTLTADVYLDKPMIGPMDTRARRIVVYGAGGEGTVISGQIGNTTASGTRVSVTFTYDGPGLILRLYNGSGNEADVIRWDSPMLTEVGKSTTYFDGDSPDQQQGEPFPADFGTPGSTGRVLVVNNGDEDAYTVFRVRGGMSSGVSIIRVNTGETLTLSRAIPSNSTVTFDSATGRVTIDGAENDVSGSLVKDQWWSTPAKTSEEIQFLPLGSLSGSPLMSQTTYHPMF